MIEETVFAVGQVVVATGRLDGYRNHLTEGKQYTVVKYDPRYPSERFNWPAYVYVVGDMGETVGAHTYRFKALDT